MVRRFVLLLCLAWFGGVPPAAAMTCGEAAGHAAEALHQAGFADAQIARGDDGGLVATWPGKARGDGVLVLLAPAGADGGFVDAMGRLAQDRGRPRRTVKLALTCDAAATPHDLVDGAMVFRPADEAGPIVVGGKVVAQTVIVAGKTDMRFVLTTRNRGGRWAEPRPDNAVYQLAHALDRVEGYVFPVEFTPVVQGYFREAGTARGDALGQAMVALAADPADRRALWQVDTDGFAHANIRTTCVVTRIEGGDGQGLPPGAQASLACGVIPGHDPEEIRRRIETVIGDPEVMVTLVSATPAPPAVEIQSLAPLRRQVSRLTGVPLIPAMANGAGPIAALGVPGDPHGLDALIHAHAF